MSERKVQQESLKLLIGISGLVLLLAVASGLAIYYAFGAWEKSSHFGESFGALNTLFSGWALAGVIYTLWLQKKSLEEQRLQFLKADEDLALTHAERATTHDMLNRQVKALNGAIKIQAIQLYLQYLDKQIKISDDKVKLVAEKERQFETLKALLESEQGGPT